MLPSKEDNNYLFCTLCNNKKAFSKKIKNSYKNKKEIHHYTGEAYKNENKMNKWES